MRRQNLLITLFYSIVLSLSIIISNSSFAQTPFYQDVYYGGVTGDGYSPWNLESPGTFDIYIEPGSSIRKAYLFTTFWSDRPIQNQNIGSRTIIFNGNNLTLNFNYFVSAEFTECLGFCNYLNTIAIDVTSLISEFSSSYQIVPPSNQDFGQNNGIFSGYYLYVCYENPVLAKVGTTIIMNNENSDALVNYTFNGLINYSQDVGLSFNGHTICNDLDDGSYVYINGNLLGVTGGLESPGSEPGCTGVRGAFYYQNNTLYGLDNDTANTTMNGVDALANIQPYITNSSQFDVTFEYQTPPGGEETNSILELFFSYTTPCDTFSVTVPNDTTLCSGEQLQLNVTGGQSYAWESTSSTGLSQLSCTDCPNPVFTADTSAFYSIRIWNNDSCSVIRPLFIKVNDLDVDSLTITPPDCGASNGEIIVHHSAFQSTNLSFIVNGDTIPAENGINNIAEGVYTISLLDEETSCTGAMETVQVNAVNITIAQFGLTPSSGEAPLEVELFNNSQNATNYAWYINGDYISNQLDNYTLENGGDYTIELVAWQYDPSCADTFAMIVLVSEVIIPTAFTPNNDGVNDTWEILQLNDYFPDNTVSIYDRWGSLIYQKENGTYPNEPWDGTYNSEALPTGSYFYIIEPNDGNTEAFEGSVSIIRE